MISFFKACECSLNNLEKKYKEINFLILKKYNLNPNFNVAISLISKEAIHKMNSSFRKVNRPTDVLSFSYFDDFKNKKFLNKNPDMNIIGEIYICPDVAAENIKEEDTTLEKEMIDLFIHGMLHILGYDHIKEKEAIVMRKEHESIKDSLNEELIKKLVKEAKDATKLSYAPYSNFKVGAALYLKNKKIIKGANIENSAYSMTTCAERCAMFSCIAQGEDIKSAEYLAVYTDTVEYASPCGACRQVMKELLDPKCRIILINSKLQYKVVSIAELLPFGFTDKDLFSNKK